MVLCRFFAKKLDVSRMDFVFFAIHLINICACGLYMIVFARTCPSLHDKRAAVQDSSFLFFSSGWLRSRSAGR